MKLPSHVAITILAFASAAPSTGHAQSRASSSRAAAIVASFNKSKHVVKERHGVRVEKFKEVKSVPVVPAQPSAFSGSYGVPDMGASLRIQIDDAGRVTGSGTDPLGDNSSVARRFTIRDARLDGALITGTKVYGDGSSSKLEGVFINRTSFDRASDNGTTTFGLGVVTALERNGQTFDRLFYQRIR